MAAVTTTETWNALLTLTLKNYRKTLEDTISLSNYVWYKVMRGPMYKKLQDLGERMKLNLMYQLGSADTYEGYDVLDTTPIDGITSAFYDWRQAAVGITISNRERKLNRGRFQIMALLEAKIKQAEMGIEELFSKMLLQGNGINTAADIFTAYVSPSTGRLGITPINQLVAYDPTTITCGGIAASETWWRNKTFNSVATTYVAWFRELDNLYNNVCKGPGGNPDIHICDQATFEQYIAALRTFHQNPSYREADIPFDNVRFHGNPVTWDELVCDVAAPSTSITEGSWFMINSAFLAFWVDAETNFANDEFVKPNNQDAVSSHILHLGQTGVNNRRKHGVMGDIALNMT